MIAKIAGIVLIIIAIGLGVFLFIGGITPLIKDKKPGILLYLKRPALRPALPYAPEQPIAFSHKTHAEINGLDCLFCHIYAKKSTVAGVPSVQACFNCHKIVGLANPAIKDEVMKVLDYWNKKMPIPWIKVYNLPDHVYFSHKRHVIKGVDCAECHGEVKKMDRVQKISSLEMGWCLECHRKNEVDKDCLICHK